MKGKRILVSVLVVMVMIVFSSTIARADQTDKLIEILKEKGTITEEEAKSLEKEVKGAESGKEAEGEASSDDDWTKNIEVGYKKGAYIKTTDDRFSVKMNVHTQGAFSYEVQEDQENTTTFKVRRARLLFGGNVYYPWMRYFTQITLEGSNTGLRDAYIEATYFDWAEPKIGQYKVPFDREFLTSAFSLQLIDRSIDAGYQIRVNSVYPGYTYTPMMDKEAADLGLTIEQYKERVAKWHPIGHIGEAIDVAYAVVYLASDESKQVTGVELMVDGGWSAK